MDIDGFSKEMDGGFFLLTSRGLSGKAFTPGKEFEVLGCKGSCFLAKDNTPAGLLSVAG
jgi:hypothetical protein